MSQPNDTDSTAEFDYYLPGMPRFAPTLGRVERFLVDHFGHHLRR